MPDESYSPDGDRPPLRPASPQPVRSHDQAINGGQIGVAIAGDVNGDIILPPATPPQPSAAELLGLARRSLVAHQYGATLSACAQVLQETPENPAAHLLSAIAALHGDYADRLDVPAIKSVEASLEIATRDTQLAATAWAVLAIITWDFDKNRGWRKLSRPFSAAKACLKGAGIAAIDDTLLDCVRTTPATRRSILS